MDRTFLFSCLIYCACSLPIHAQLFEPVSISPLTTTPGDSRSVNLVDVNGDGRDDVFITNGPKDGQNNHLFLNTGDGHLQQVTDDPIVQDSSPSDGAAFADVDGDGDLDAFVVTWYGEANLFYRNRGNGTFVREAGWEEGTFSETAAWGDYDGDGRPDLYVTNSTDFATNAPEIQRNLLYRNKGEGKFEKITGLPLTEAAAISRSAQWIDYDGDGKTDLFVSNEEDQPNQLYRNRGRGEFEAVDNAVTAGAFSSTGSSWADVDNDGDLDLFVANYQNQPNQLFFNEGNGKFTEASPSDLSRDGGCSFGSAFGDADNDGDLDLFVTNAFCEGPLQNFYYENDGRGRFWRDQVVFPDLTTGSSYGAAWGDLDGDGFLDLVVAHCRRSSSDPDPANAYYRNKGNRNHWLKLQLQGPPSNPSAIGAVVRVRTRVAGKPYWQMRVVETQSGYCGQNSLIVHFGLGESGEADRVVVEWPDGEKTVRKEVRADQVVRIKWGEE